MRFDGLPQTVIIREVGPRDGFQSAKEEIPTDKKLEFIDEIISAGISEVEVTSFVSPKAVPQMADAAEVLAAVKKKYPMVQFTTLVPNRRGAENALMAGADVLNYVFSASESHNKANVNRTVEESLSGIQDLLDLVSLQAKLSVSIATSFMCPFEGPVSPHRVVELIKRIRDLGVHSICLAETIGTCHPRAFKKTLETVQPLLTDLPVYLHIHDTFGFGLLNVKVALDLGFNRFDSSIGGLGGCPFAPGAAGNVATEDIVFFLQGLEIETGLDPVKLTDTARNLQAFGLNTMGHLVASRFGFEL